MPRGSACATEKRLQLAPWITPPGAKSFKKGLPKQSECLLSAPFSHTTNQISVMPREHIILECTEARAEGKPVSRYMSTRDKKQQPDRVEKKKYNKFLRRHTLHREIKG